ncbi:hypothetical protein LY76DRAFT_24713 [Colletotrichum caudatum]|nr:hypothetical protein LY76DRAFT_24713 [Colletotrichum caudatum]
MHAMQLWCLSLTSASSRLVISGIWNFSTPPKKSPNSEKWADSEEHKIQAPGGGTLRKTTNTSPKYLPHSFP